MAGTPTLQLDDHVTTVVSNKVAAVLANPPFRITTVRDLLWYLPRQDAYKDLGAVLPITDLIEGQPATVTGTVHGWERIIPRRRGGKSLRIDKITVADDDGRRITATFFNQPWQPAQHKAGSGVAISGTVDRYRNEMQLKGPKLIGLDTDGRASDPDLDQSLQPVYRATEKMASPKMARLIADALDGIGPITDHLPEHLIDARDVPALDWALRTIHAPEDTADLEAARRRLVYDELLGLQLTLQSRRQELEREAKGMDNGPADEAEDGAVAAFQTSLPFAPTADQQAAFDAIDTDLSGDAPMHRLLQGDVGTGKTLVAAHAMLRAVDRGRQAVLMAPTTVLAEQHLRTFSELLASVVIPRLGRQPRLRLLTSNMTKTARSEVLNELLVGDCDLLIGTHAVLEDNVMFADLGVVVIDEQHRFGVGHRLALASKRADGTTPDVLVMTATPIPRSLALTMYGDLDVTVLRNRPGADRITVTTQVIGSDSPRREKLYDFVRSELDAGRRAYVVCPLIEPSEALEGVAAAEQVHAELSDGPFAGYEVGLMHGRMRAEDRDAVMAAFRDGSVPLLVATTVIEVGVSVDDATVMIIEDADRFGISQLHQLRGRLFRGHPTNFCVLFSDDPVDNPRLDALAASDDGFVLAEEDLRLRREGKLFDTAQTGETDLRIANLIAHADTLSIARDDAAALLDADPHLAGHPELLAELGRRYDPADLVALEAG